MKDILDQITDLLVARLEDVLYYFEIDDFQRYQDRISLSCPLHGSQSPESLSIFIDGIDITGNWKCWTHHCEDEILHDNPKSGEVDRPRGKNIFGLIRGLMSIKYNRHIEYAEAIIWSKNFVGLSNISDDEVEDEESSNRRFVRLTNLLNRERELNGSTITRTYIRNRLKIPSSYFLERGFREETLDRYDVGFCGKQNKEMYNRVVVPIYDDNYEYMVGCVGRTLQPKCSICGTYHYEDRHCPQNVIEKRWGRKWLNSNGFNSGDYLYNYWFAKSHIEETGTAILVEGQGDVWRLEESGIKIGLGIFGSSLSDEQKLLLDSLNVFNLVILTDSDEAGIEARKKIVYKCERTHNCHFIDLPAKDIGEMETGEVRKLVEPLLERI